MDEGREKGRGNKNRFEEVLGGDHEIPVLPLSVVARGSKETTGDKLLPTLLGENRKENFPLNCASISSTVTAIKCRKQNVSRKVSC